MISITLSTINKHFIKVRLRLILVSLVLWLLPKTLTQAQYNYFLFPIWHPSEDIIAVTNAAVVRIYSSDFTQLLDEYSLVEGTANSLRLGHMAWSPNGTMLAVSITGEGFPFKLQAWNLQTGQQVIEIDDVNTYVPFVWGSDSDRIVVVNNNTHGDDTIRIYAIPSGTLIQEFTPDDPANINQFAWSPARNQAIIHLSGSYASLYAIDTMTGIFTAINNDFLIDYGYEYNPSGSLIAGVQREDDTVVEVWDTTTFNVVSTLVGHSDTALATWMNANTVVTVSWDGTTRYWNAQTGQQLALFETSEIAIPRFNPDGTRFVATAYDEESIYVRDTLTGAVVAVLDGSGTLPPTSTPQRH